ncbi:MAG: uncharacterized protein A8A55_0327 [Amphiamblys sp. WSBS2006]|nr:MAG: uncharacterized protein A8A55_0327 [Amphiamblys sp. WSBS2006]
MFSMGEFRRVLDEVFSEEGAQTKQVSDRMIEAEVRLKRAYRKSEIEEVDKESLKELFCAVLKIAKRNKSIVSIATVLASMLGGAVEHGECDGVVDDVVFLFSNCAATKKAKELGIEFSKISRLFVARVSELPWTLQQKKLFFKDMLKRKREGEIDEIVLKDVRATLSGRPLRKTLDDCVDVAGIGSVLRSETVESVFEKEKRKDKLVLAIGYCVSANIAALVEKEDRVFLLKRSPEETVLWTGTARFFDDAARCADTEARLAVLSAVDGERVSGLGTKLFWMFIDGGYLDQHIPFRDSALRLIRKIGEGFRRVLREDKDTQTKADIERTLEKTVRFCAENMNDTGRGSAAVQCAKLFSVLYSELHCCSSASALFHSGAVQAKLFCLMRSTRSSVRESAVSVLSMLPLSVLRDPGDAGGIDEEAADWYHAEKFFLLNRDIDTGSFVEHRLDCFEADLLRAKKGWVTGFVFSQSASYLLRLFQKRDVAITADAFERIYGCVLGVSALVEGALSVACPEGRTLSTRGKQTETFFKWRTLRDTLRMFSLAIRCRYGSGEIPKEKVKTIYFFFVELLCRLKHRGAFHTAYKAMSAVCRHFGEARDQNEEVIRWLAEEVLRVVTSSTDILTARRSGGFPFCVTAAAHSYRKRNYLPAFFIEKLSSFLDGKPAQMEFVVSAYNTLRSLFEDGAIASETGQFVPVGVRLALEGFGSSEWKVKNSAMMLFQSCVKRIPDGLPLGRFCILFKQQREYLEGVLRGRKKETELPVLLLLQKIEALDGEDAFSRLSIEFVSQCSFSENRKTAETAIALCEKTLSLERKVVLLEKTSPGKDRQHGRVFLRMLRCLFEGGRKKEAHKRLLLENEDAFIENGLYEELIGCMVYCRGEARCAEAGERSPRNRSHLEARRVAVEHALLFLSGDTDSVSRYLRIVESGVHCGEYEAHLFTSLFSLPSSIVAVPVAGTTCTLTDR